MVVPDRFPLPADHRHVVLHFDGINNRANVWINGKKIADAKDVAGAYRKFEFNITPELAETGRNVIAVEVFAQTQNDLGINWVDWNPTPPDKNMGLWQDVYLTTSGPVQIRHPAVVTHLVDNDGATVELTILVELHNASDKAVEGKLQAEMPRLRLRVEQAESLEAGETKSVKLIPQDFAQLAVKNAKLWWPAQMGSPNLYDLHTSFLIADAISDSHHTRVGIREITSDIISTTDNKARLFRVNGKPILIRGGGWAADMMLRRNPERLRAEFQYVQDMNLNTIRLEGKIESDEFFNLADEKGILIMAGWCCCDLWEEWDKWNGDQLSVARESVRSQSLRLRAHPSLLMWLNASDKPPPAEVEEAYLQVLKETSWPNPIVSSGSETRAQLTALVEVGGLMSYGTDVDDGYRLAAVYAGRRDPCCPFHRCHSVSGHGCHPWQPIPVPGHPALPSLVPEGPERSQRSRYRQPTGPQFSVQRRPSSTASTPMPCGRRDGVPDGSRAPRNVGGAAGGKADDDAYGPRRIRLRPCDSRSPMRR